MLMKNIALYQMRRITTLPVGCFVLSGPCFRISVGEQSTISGEIPETDMNSGRNLMISADTAPVSGANTRN
jgi:hypothetical protein